MPNFNTPPQQENLSQNLETAGTTAINKISALLSAITLGEKKNNILENIIKLIPALTNFTTNLGKDSVKAVTDELDSLGNNVYKMQVNPKKREQFGTRIKDFLDSTRNIIKEDPDATNLVNWIDSIASSVSETATNSRSFTQNDSTYNVSGNATVTTMKTSFIGRVGSDYVNNTEVANHSGVENSGENIDIEILNGANDLIDSIITQFIPNSSITEEQTTELNNLVALYGSNLKKAINKKDSNRLKTYTVDFVAELKKLTKNIKPPTKELNAVVEKTTKLEAIIKGSSSANRRPAHFNYGRGDTINIQNINGNVRIGGNEGGIRYAGDTINEIPTNSEKLIGGNHKISQDKYIENIQNATIVVKAGVILSGKYITNCTVVLEPDAKISFKYNTNNVVTQN